MTDQVDIQTNNGKGYDIYDRQTGLKVGHAKTLKAASRSANKRDLDYGACRYGYRKPRD